MFTFSHRPMAMEPVSVIFRPYFNLSSYHWFMFCWLRCWPTQMNSKVGLKSHQQKRSVKILRLSEWRRSQRWRGMTQCWRQEGAGPGTPWSCPAAGCLRIPNKDRMMPVRIIDDNKGNGGGGESSNCCRESIRPIRPSTNLFHQTNLSHQTWFIELHFPPILFQT